MCRTTFKFKQRDDIGAAAGSGAARSEPACANGRARDRYARHPAAPPGRYAADAIRFRSVTPSMGIRRGLMLSLNGSMSCSIPWR